MFTTTIHEGHIYGESCEGLRAYAVEPMHKFMSDATAHKACFDKTLSVLGLGGRAFRGEAISDNQILWVEVE